MNSSIRSTLNTYYIHILSIGLCLAVFTSSSLATDLSSLSDSLSTPKPSRTSSSGINRQQLVERHNPVIRNITPSSPLTLGNGKFAFTADVTGLQSLSEFYYAQGTPLETKARWAWHSRKNPKAYTLAKASKKYNAYGIKVAFPTNMDSNAGQWLRKNPHDLPLARLALYMNDLAVKPEQLSDIHQTLDLWRGHLKSQYNLQDTPVTVGTAIHGQRDLLAAKIHSPLVAQGKLALSIQFPRGYNLDKKNTPNLDWSHPYEHSTTLVELSQNSAQFLRRIDNTEYNVILRWKGEASIIKFAPHHYLIKTAASQRENLELTLEYVNDNDLNFQPNLTPVDYLSTVVSAEITWKEYWMQGAAISLQKSTDPRAKELERRIILSQYLMGSQARGSIPTQETGLTSSSWYGKHHTEMTWWHTAHWIYWNRPEQAKRVLAWYIERLDEAKKRARSRGLTGARWAKMVGPWGRESPGGNPLIIWNQPQVIHLAELLYQQEQYPKVLQEYQQLVEETAKTLSSMLMWEPKQKRFSLLPPIWISQEIYPAEKSKNPSFELSYWRYGLATAQEWRKRLGKNPNALWEKQLKQLAPLPHKNGRYVAIESIPDTFDDISRRKDHPTMLAPWGLLQDPTVDKKMMSQTLDAVLNNWDWEEKIWGWDYPMIAMTALQLGDTKLAFDILLTSAPHNHYLINGHCPQQGASLPVYLPANGALLTAMAMIAAKWESQPTAGWHIQAEGFNLE